jgi:hypothetical protein
MAEQVKDQLDVAELEAMDGELLPRREAMSVLGPVPGAAVDAAIESAADTVEAAADADSET